MGVSHLADYSVHPTAHILDAFATRAARRKVGADKSNWPRPIVHSPILPDDPTGVSLLYLRRQEAFIFTVIPLPNFFSYNVVRDLREVTK